MHMEQTLQKMRKLRLTAMANSLEQRLEKGEHRDMDPESFVSHLIDDEVESRATKQIKNLIRRAKLRPEQACLENINHSAKRGFSKKDLDRFHRTDWIDRAENMVFTGATGTGKTYLSEALAFQACRMRRSARKMSQDMLLEEIRINRAMGKYSKFMKEITNVDVLVIDDFAIAEYDSHQYSEILHILEERLGKSCTVITSQYPGKLWFERIPDPTLADAICDRLLRTSWVLEMQGDSQRKAPK
jgi:DNA replication protein DnaC